MDQQLLKTYIKAAMSDPAMDVPGSACPNHDRLLAYYRSPSGAADRASLDAHLAVCPACAETLQDIADFINQAVGQKVGG